MSYSQVYSDCDNTSVLIVIILQPKYTRMYYIYIYMYMTYRCKLCCYTSSLPWSPTPTHKQPFFFCCQPDEPQGFPATTNRSINVNYVPVLILLFMYAVSHCLYSVGSEITTDENNTIIINITITTATTTGLANDARRLHVHLSALL